VIQTIHQYLIKQEGISKKLAIEFILTPFRMLFWVPKVYVTFTILNTYSENHSKIVKQATIYIGTSFYLEV